MLLVINNCLKLIKCYSYCYYVKHCLFQINQYSQFQNINKINTNLAMETRMNCLKPPEKIRGITELNKDLFEKSINLQYLRINKPGLSKVLKVVRNHLLKISHFKPVQNVDENMVDLYLNPMKFVSWDSFTEEDKEKLLEFGINSANLSEKEVMLGYDNYTPEDIFRAVLPENQEGSASFSKVGHIIHVNLRDHLLPFKYFIGEVLCDKISNCRTVVNKTNNIDNTYRNFTMEVLYGENDMQAKLKENNCTFEFDFSTVYWNSRLSTEHLRIVNKLTKDDVLFDVFAGVGPFSIPAAKKKCTVFANDLNPESYKWLNHNKRINKISDDCLRTFNKGGYDFIVQEIKEHLPQFLNKKNVHIVMNLPALAVEFLHLFVGLLKDSEKIIVTNCPIVHVYCFAKGENPEEIAKELLFKNIRSNISDKIVDVFQVRTVSSMKEMMRVSFKLDSSILFGDIAIDYNSNKRKLEGSDTTTLNKKCNQSEES